MEEDQGQSISSSELPTLIITKSRYWQNFEIEKIDLSVRGWTDESARENMEWLIKKYHESFKE